jgi:predicted small secreted protein
MGLFCKKLIFSILLFILVLQLSGCGETFHGMGKDVQRVGKGVKTIFIRDSE